MPSIKYKENQVLPTYLHVDPVGPTSTFRVIKYAQCPRVKDFMCLSQFEKFFVQLLTDYFIQNETSRMK